MARWTGYPPPVSAPTPTLTRLQGSLLLLFVAFVWGTTFVAMKTAFSTTVDGRAAIGVMTLLGLRFLLGAAVVLPFALREGRRHTGAALSSPMLIRFGLLGLVLAAASYFQQLGVSQTTVTNAGFLSSLYVPLVPLIVFAILRQPVRPIVWFGVGGCLIGACFLTGAVPDGLDDLSTGDGWVMFSTLFWAVHVIGLGLLALRSGRPLLLAAVQFFIAGLLGCIGGLVLEDPFLAGVIAVWPQILYAGILSVGIAYTLQGVAQRAVSAPATALLLSTEMVFAAIAGAVVLQDRLGPAQWAGAALILGCLVAVELAGARHARRSRASSV